jgi:hypothetical protein
MPRYAALRGRVRPHPRQPFTRQVWHRILKSGCRIEACQLAIDERLERYLRLYSVIAWQVFYALMLARAVQVHVMFTLLLFALATAYQLQCKREAIGGKPVGWPRWRRQLLEQTREQVIVCAQGYYGIFHLAGYALLAAVKLKDRPPGIGTRQHILAKYKLITRH